MLHISVQLFMSFVTSGAFFT